MIVRYQGEHIDKRAVEYKVIKRPTSMCYSNTNLFVKSKITTIYLCKQPNINIKFLKRSLSLRFIPKRHILRYSIIHFIPFNPYMNSNRFIHQNSQFSPMITKTKV